MTLFSIITAEEQVYHGLDESAAILNLDHPLACLAHFVDLISSLSRLLCRWKSLSSMEIPEKALVVNSNSPVLGLLYQRISKRWVLLETVHVLLLHHIAHLLMMTSRWTQFSVIEQSQYLAHMQVFQFQIWNPLLPPYEQFLIVMEEHSYPFLPWDLWCVS